MSANFSVFVIRCLPNYCVFGNPFAAGCLLMQPRLVARVFGAESSKRVAQPRFQVFHLCRIEEANGKALLALLQVTLE